MCVIRPFNTLARFCHIKRRERKKRPSSSSSFYRLSRRRRRVRSSFEAITRKKGGKSGGCFTETVSSSANALMNPGAANDDFLPPPFLSRSQRQMSPNANAVQYKTRVTVLHRTVKTIQYTCIQCIQCIQVIFLSRKCQGYS